MIASSWRGTALPLRSFPTSKHLRRPLQPRRPIWRRIPPETSTGKQRDNSLLPKCQLVRLAFPGLVLQPISEALGKAAQSSSKIAYSYREAHQASCGFRLSNHNSQITKSQIPTDPRLPAQYQCFRSQRPRRRSDFPRTFLAAFAGWRTTGRARARDTAWPCRR